MSVLLSGRLSLLLCALCLPSLGLASPWFARTWRVNDGLPSDNVTGIAQDASGYLWLSTQSGLARFDGINLQTIPIPVGGTTAFVRAMLLDKSGRLWLGEEGGSIALIENGSGTMFTAGQGLPTSQPLSILQDFADRVWVAYADGTLCAIAEGRVERYAEHQGLSGSGPCSLGLDADGKLWVAQAGQAGTIEEGKFKVMHTFPDRYVQLGECRTNGLWVCAGRSLYRWARGSAPAKEEGFALPPGAGRPTAVLEDVHGAIWIGTLSSGLYHWDGKEVAPVETSHNRIRQLVQDREGNIWAGTDGGGLNRLRPRVVELKGKESGLSFDTIRSVTEDRQGIIWVITQNAEVSLYREGQWERLSGTSQWTGGQATSVAADLQGNVWIGTYSRGLYRWDGSKFTNLRAGEGLASNSIRSLLVDGKNRLWIAFTAGQLVQAYDGSSFESFKMPEGSRAVRAMAEDKDGNIWLANLDARLMRVKGNEIIDETMRTPPPWRPIRSLCATPDGALWIGYATAGIGRFQNGTFVRAGREQGLADGGICAIQPDRQGNFWIAADHGIFRVDRKSLGDLMDGKNQEVFCRIYGEDDGLPSLQGAYGYSPGTSLCQDGRVLLPTHSGLVIAHPSIAQPPAVPPNVLIEAVYVDDRSVPAPQLRSIELKPSHRKIAVRFTAPSFIAPEQIRFEYRLEGWDDRWYVAGKEREANYSRLPAGDYRFLVRADNRMGLWSTRPAQVDFAILPFWYQKAWIQMLGLGLFAALIFGTARFISVRRLNAQLARLENENALQRERARIAQDIHDDLGARMTQISLLTEVTRGAMKEPGKANEKLDQIAFTAREGMKSLDEIVWAVNPRNDTLPDLLDYAGKFAVEFLSAAEIRCRVDFPARPEQRMLSAETRHNIFLAFKETLNNIVKHSGATEVCLKAEITRTTLRLSIRDNGRGFAESPPAALEDGLRNMRRRLADLKGSCTVESSPGKGVSVYFEVPWEASLPAPANGNSSNSG